MLTLTGKIIHVLRPFERVLSERVWEWANVLLIGAILAPGERTVAAILRVMRCANENQFQNYHRVLNRATWSLRELSHRLLLMLVKLFAPGDEALVIGIDETIERRRGRRLAARGVYRDPVCSSKEFFVKTHGLRWISMMLLAQLYVLDTSRSSSRSWHPKPAPLYPQRQKPGACHQETTSRTTRRLHGLYRGADCFHIPNLNSAIAGSRSNVRSLRVRVREPGDTVHGAFRSRISVGAWRIGAIVVRVAPHIDHLHAPINGGGGNLCITITSPGNAPHWTCMPRIHIKGIVPTRIDEVTQNRTSGPERSAAYQAGRYDTCPNQCEELATGREAVSKREGLGENEINALLRQAQSSRDGTRNYAIVQLLLQTGLRLDECSHLMLSDIEFGERSGQIIVRAGRQREQSTDGPAQRLRSSCSGRLSCSALPV